MKLVALLLPLLLVAPAAADRPADTKELTRRALDALRRGDTVAFAGLLMTHDDVRRHCPAVLDQLGKKFFERARKKADRRVKECAAAFDWKQARLQGISGGKADRPDKTCPNVVELTDIRASYKVGRQLWLVKLDDPVLFDGKLVALSDAPRCRKDAIP